MSDKCEEIEITDVEWMFRQVFPDVRFVVCKSSDNCKVKPNNRKARPNKNSTTLNAKKVARRGNKCTAQSAEDTSHAGTDAIRNAPTAGRK